MEKQTSDNSNNKPLIFWVLILALALRLIHLASSANNPMTYHPGTDETFYLNFGFDVAQGQFGLNKLYIFMDPLYGYLVGFFHWITGSNLFVIYFFQVLVDVFTVWIVYEIGKTLWSYRAGVIAALLYALASTAIFYTTTILKPTLVANFVALWVLLTIKIPYSKSFYALFGYGVFLGLGVALRSNLLLLCFASLFIIIFIHIKEKNHRKIPIILIYVFIGFSLPSIMLGTRNKYITDHWSILPPNSGIVLHQLYNPDNPESVQFSPDFVSYRSPPEILAGYTNEAEKRLGQKMSAYEVSDYWRKQALLYITKNPDEVFNNILRKSREFVSFKEIENNRFFNEEAAFSTILTFLPKPFGWLIALGLPGLLILALRQQTSSLSIIAATALVFLSFVIFLATARFRMHGMPLFSVGAGIFIAALLDYREAGKNKIISAVFLSMILGILTLWSGYQFNTKSEVLMEFAQGYLKMGNPEQAKLYALQQINLNPSDAGPYELLGYMALNEKKYNEAILLLNNATTLAPHHHIAQYNLALSLSKTEQLENSLVVIERAITYRELPEYLYLKGQILEQLGNKAFAISAYKKILDMDSSSNNLKLFSIKAQNRLDLIK